MFKAVFLQNGSEVDEIEFDTRHELDSFVRCANSNGYPIRYNEEGQRIIRGIWVAIITPKLPMRKGR